MPTRDCFWWVWYTNIQYLLYIKKSQIMHYNSIISYSPNCQNSSFQLVRIPSQTYINSRVHSLLHSVSMDSCSFPKNVYILFFSSLLRKFYYISCSIYNIIYTFYFQEIKFSNSETQFLYSPPVSCYSWKWDITEFYRNTIHLRQFMSKFSSNIFIGHYHCQI